MFELRDTQQPGSNFSGRVNDVFSALGSGSVKPPDKSDDKDIPKPDFDQQQLYRSTKHSRPDKTLERKAAGGGRFKHPAEALRPQHRGNRRLERGGGRSIPDFKKNPGKWTKYSLADVDNMTERSNTAAALQFLQTIKDSKTTDEQPAFDPSQKVVFKKPGKKDGKAGEQRDKETREPLQPPQTTDDDMDCETTTTSQTPPLAPRDKPVFSGAKQIMPEYNFGAKRDKKTKDKKSLAAKSAKPAKEMRLSHLDEECDE